MDSGEHQAGCHGHSRAPALPGEEQGRPQATAWAEVRAGLARCSAAALVEVAVAAAETTLQLFAASLPSRASDLRSALRQCRGGGLDAEALTSALRQLESLVPDSEDEPAAGAAIPAGEAVLAALRVALNPTPTTTMSAVESAYTALEMKEFLDAEATSLRHGVEVAETSPSVTSFLEQTKALVRRLASQT